MFILPRAEEQVSDLKLCVRSLIYDLESREFVHDDAASLYDADTEGNANAGVALPQRQLDDIPADEDIALIDFLNNHGMQRLLAPLHNYGVDDMEDLIDCLDVSNDEGLEAIGLPRDQIRCLRKAAETWETSDSAHEAAEPAQHPAASSPLPPQQEHTSPNQHRQLAIPYLKRCDTGESALNEAASSRGADIKSNTNIPTPSSLTQGGTAELWAELSQPEQFEDAPAQERTSSGGTMNYGLEAKEGAVIEAASRNSAVTEKNTSAAPIIPPKSEFEDTEVAAGREALINLMNKNRMLHVLELLLKFGVETLEDLIYCMRNYDDEELMKYIGLLRFQILRLRKAAKTWETSDSAHEAAQPAQHQAASTLRPPQQEQIAPNHQKLHAGRGPPARSLAKYSGVSFDKIKSSQKKMWKAQIRIDGKKKHIDWFSTAEAAARAYDEECAKHGRPRANFPTDKAAV